MRRREISPEFWTDEKVVELTDAAKLLFIGLWNLADREGRLEDRPKTIGFKLRPWAPGEVAALLVELHAIGLIDRYESEGLAVVSIPRFAEHQRPHPKEMPSKLPASGASREITRPVAELHGEPGNSGTNRAGSSGSSGSSFPSGPSGAGPSGFAGLAGATPPAVEGELFASPPPQPKPPPAPKSKPPKAPKVEPSPDPRHAPLLRDLDGVFLEDRGAPLAVDGYTAKAVSQLLAKGEPEEVLRRWRLALAEPRYPKVATPGELVRTWDHWTGTAPRGAPPPDGLHVGGRLIASATCVVCGKAGATVGWPDQGAPVHHECNRVIMDWCAEQGRVVYEGGARAWVQLAEKLKQTNATPKEATP